MFTPATMQQHALALIDMHSTLNLILKTGLKTNTKKGITQVSMSHIHILYSETNCAYRKEHTLPISHWQSLKRWIQQIVATLQPFLQKQKGLNQSIPWWLLQSSTKQFQFLKWVGLGYIVKIPNVDKSIWICFSISARGCTVLSWKCSQSSNTIT